MNLLIDVEHFKTAKMLSSNSKTNIEIKHKGINKDLLDRDYSYVKKTIISLVELLLGNSFGGIELSGGQWQQLAISRARFKSASIYILDEANSSLDFESENKVCTFMKQDWQDKTVLFITHRLTPVYSADRIFFIKKGKMIAEGTHEELINECESYRKMYKNGVEKNKADLQTESNFSC